jgi:hypothetical protein
MRFDDIPPTLRLSANLASGICKGHSSGDRRNAALEDLGRRGKIKRNPGGENFVIFTSPEQTELNPTLSLS